MREPKVTLISHTNSPLETVYSVWHSSKTEDELLMPDEVRRTIPSSEVVDLFKAVIKQRIPVGEHIDFVFMLENISVSWREQAVRHRIGTLASPERLGVDIIPDLQSSSYWSQSMRLMDMSAFANKKRYRLPKTVVEAGPKAVAIYEQAMENAGLAYAELLDEGVPMEDARETIPIGAQHRISWKLNISSLQHIVGERGCWILQLGIWGPIIKGMIEELATKVHPVFRELVAPPCMDGNNFTGCVYQEECRRRLDKEDQLPPCPLHLYNEAGLDGMVPHSDFEPVFAVEKYDYTVRTLPMKEQMLERAKEYREFWGRDPFTGEFE